MKTETVTKYTTSDGTIFYDEDKATKHEFEYAGVRAVMVQLPEVDLASNEFKQHDIETAKRVKRELFALVLSMYGESYPHWRAWKGDDVHPRSVVGRVLDDSGGPLSAAWGRLCRIDFSTGREYQQPYFVAHPSEATKEVR